MFWVAFFVVASSFMSTEVRSEHEQVTDRIIDVSSDGDEARTIVYVAEEIVSTEQAKKKRYLIELFTALHSEETMLNRVSRLSSGMALAFLRVSQWHDHLMRTQQRRPNWQDKMGYMFMENEVMPYADRCYVLSQSEFPLLYGTVAQYADVLAIPVPLILLVDDRKLCDATAASWSKKSGFLILSRGLFEELSDAELCGLIAHEMGHIVQRFQAKMTCYFTPVAIAGFFGTLAALYALISYKSEIVWWHIASALVVTAGYGIFAALYWCFLSRHYEHEADCVAARIQPENALAMIQAMQRNERESLGGDLANVADMVNGLSALLPQQRMRALSDIHDTRRAYMRAARDGSYELGIFGTHRSLKKREAFFKRWVDAVTDTP